MLKLNTMDLADAFTPKELVDAIFKQCPNLKPPIPIKEIALAAGIKKIGTLNSENIEGMLVTDEGKNEGVIYYNSHEKPVGRQRFTIGHELGHFLLLHHNGINGIQTCDSADLSLSSKDCIEKEANEFAQLLLLPDKLIKNAYRDKQPCLTSLEKVADNFEMSLEATANKCTKYGLKPFALVYSLNGVVRYCWKDHKRLPYYSSLKKGSQMPSSSQAVTLNLSEQTITQFTTAKATCWFNPSPKYDLPETILEQTYFQKRGYKVTLLVVE
ncbi:ImmA/IrrE family metallo-endopeptidase [Pseudoalteromonas aliena]|uniref:ImmA/IrrE family metallo-endopeptidase n=1 Tax=Pseudoalteromonas aliena TaxID=247523 RepID=UPI00311FF3A6